MGALLGNCVSLDLEVDPRTARLFAFAAVRTGDGEVCRHSGGDFGPALVRLEAFCEGADHLIGHNILRHDLPHLVAQRPRLTAMGRSVIDTLWLNPLAFPRNPYHHLVKHYHDGRLQAGHVNDPELDARLVFEVLENHIAAFGHLQRDDPDALLVHHFLTTRGETSAGFDALFRAIRGAPAPSAPEAGAAIRRLLAGRACAHRIEQTLSRISNPQLGWPMAYALSWISVAGGDSVMPPWVRTQFREASLIVRHLRDTACGSPDCAWCAENNDPKRALERWFGFPAFRPEPVDEMGRPLQERIVAEAMAGKSVLGILPTGTGKSVCYQIPALSKFDKTGALTVVISPLVALMADQVQGLARAGISSAVTVNGMLSLPERHHALERVRMGDAAILLIAPEQLRSVSVRSALRQREVGLWVLDEAHCISKWGHDFRPDYRYVSRFIREFSGDEPPAPVLCLTATAKPEVVRDIREHFQSRVGQELQLLDGGAVRTNLSFSILPTQRQTKLADILDAIEADLPAEGASGAVVYCATRSATERVAQFLKAQGLAAERFHAGLPPEEKREIQERFRVGELRVIAATNAFGMGIDKPDIRLVVHGDIPGSLENYLQEAGRAGRDRQPARCVLLFAAEDVERQFGLSARSRLARHEIGAILKALRRLETRMKKNGEVVATPGEIVREEKDQEFERDRATDDTRVKTAVAWLEEATLLSREENRVQVFPSSLRIRTLEEAAGILDKAQVTGTRRTQLLDLVRHVMTAPADTGISTDDLTGACGLTGPALRKALSDLEVLGIASNDTAITIFIHVGVEDASLKRLELAARLETDLIALMREAAPDAGTREPEPLLPGKGVEIRRQTTGASWKAIVEALENPVQAEIVRDDREHTNVLVLAGPGSGKTRVLVHRIAYLVRVKREDPRGILVLTYNRHAAAEVRERLRRLIGDEAAGITVSTCHALAMRLVGASFAGDRDGPRDFDGIVMQAVALLRGDGLPKAEAEALRETLIQGYRWILVDEYQDIGPEEYALIAAVAGRTLEDRELRLSLFAVGDDDQNIYAFAGASIDFIRRFEADYAARPVYLTENYRSTGHIIAAANAVIAPAAGRMKAGHDIAVNRARAGEAPGGVMAALDPVAQGRVTLLACPPGDGMQAVAAVDELLRLSRLDPDWSWRRAAVIAREWRRLEPARTYAEQLGIPVELASETMPSLWRMREMQAFLREMLRDRARLLTIADLVGILNGLPQNRWTDLIGEGIGTLARELVEKAAPVPDLVQWFGEWAREARAEQRGLLLLTAHRAKGLEFDHVAILDGGWDRPSRGEDADAPRRLFYVAMTRARSSLTVLAQGRHPFLRSVGGAVLPREVSPDPTSLPDARRRIIAPDPRLVDLSFAGRLRDADPSLAAIAEAAVGDPVTLSRHGDRWLILDGRERVLGRMAKAFAPPEDAEVIGGEIAVVLQWRRDDGDDAYRHLIRRDEWDVVLPELDPFSRWSG